MSSKKILLTILISVFSIQALYANNLRLSDFRLYVTDVPGIFIEMDSICWDNSWRNDIPGVGYAEPHNYDAIWIFVKYKKKGSNEWISGKFMDFFYYNNLEKYIPPDSLGLFLFRKQNGTGNVSEKHITFPINNYGINGIHYNDTVDVRVFAMEMVYVPQGSFYVGDSATSDITGQFAASDNISPFLITGENQITLGGLGTNSLNNRNSSGMSSPDDFNNVDTQILPAAFPKGYRAFFCMKYEVSAQQYVDFLNTIDSNQAQARYANMYGNQRNSILKSGNKFITTAPDRANNFMSWADGAAFMDWCGLRPMTELENEKICRGPLTAIANEYAWGNTIVTQMIGFVGSDSSGTETSSPVNANCNYNLIDGGSSQPIGGPVRCGIFATVNTNTRTSSGASYYGIMDLSGNVWERPVTVGNPEGREFDGRHGDGKIAVNGDADVLNWPGANSIGSGFKCGNWFRGTLRLRVSDRFYASTGLPDRTSHRGFRGVRTVE